MTKPLSTAEQTDRNCCQLWNYAGEYFRADDQKNLVGISSWNVIERVIFWIRDALSHGGETYKVHQAVIRTLDGMNEDMAPTDKSLPIFYFITAKRGFFGESQFGHTYKELADRLNQHVNDFFPKFTEANTNEISRRAQLTSQGFDQLSFFPLYSGAEEQLRSDFLKKLCQATVSFKPVRDLEHKRAYAEFRLNQIKLEVANPNDDTSLIENSQKILKLQFPELKSW